MKLALAFPGCHRRAGVERIMLECANFLNRRGHTIDLYSTDADSGSIDRSVRIDMVALSDMHFSPALGIFDHRVSQKLKIKPPDALCTFGVVSPYDGVLWVQSVHKAWIEISQSTRPLSGRLLQKCNPIHPLLLRREETYFKRRRYARLIALTPDVKNDLKRLYDVPDADIELLPNGFSHNEFNLAQTTSKRKLRRNELDYSDEDKVLVFVANELERKGFGPLVDALARLKDKRVKLLVVGRADPAPYLRRIELLGLREQIKFVGQSAAVADYYAAADLSVLPTKYEAWGMVIIEAMACGLPVVTAKTAGAAVAVKNYENGLLLDNPLDADELAQKLSTALAQQWQPRQIEASVQQYRWDKLLETYESIVVESCKTKASQSAKS